MTASHASSFPATGELVAALHARLPHVGSRELHLAVRRAQLETGDVADLIVFLRAHEDAFSVPRSLVPTGFLSVAHVLSVTSNAAIATPFCARCRRSTYFLPTESDGGRVCMPCAELLHPCVDCGATGRARHRTPRGRLCPECRHLELYPPLRPRRLLVPRHLKKRVECVLCQEMRQPTARWPLGVVCRQCFYLTLRSRQPCTICSEIRPLIGRHHLDRVCGPCSGSQFDYSCRRCGVEDDAYTAKLCALCALRIELQGLFGEATETATTEWSALQEAFLAGGAPMKTLGWLKHSRGAAVLRQVIATRLPVTHEMLDELPSRSAVHDVRDLLVQCGLLPQRDAEYLHRIHPWLRDTLAALPAEHARVLAQFVRWYVLPKAQRTVARRGVGDSAVPPIPALVKAAARLMAWLDDRGVGLPGLTQPLLEEWLVDGRGHYRYLYSFINWTRAQGITVPGVRLSAPTYPQRANYLDPAERLSHLRRCLDDDDLPLQVRVAGALTLLFGISITKIVRLSRDDVRAENGIVSLVVGDHQLTVPPRLGSLLAELAGREHQGTGVLAQVPRSSVLLYPGRAAHRSVQPATLYAQLRNRGIAVLPARNSARLALAAALPGAVLASLTGIEATTADVWTRRVGRDWMPYIAAKDEGPGDRSL
jgi:hypothetical protein